MTKTKNQPTLNKVVVDVVTATKVDNRTNNPGRPVNKQSARYKRLQKQAFYASVNSKFVKGNQFQVDGSSSKYKYRPSDDGLGCIVETVFGSHVCNVSYIGRTKVQAYSFTLGKRVKVELNLKTLKFVK